jgi:hypothetical protein
MTESEEKEDKEDSLSLSLGFLKLRLSGQHLGQFLPWVGWCLVIVASAYAISVIMGRSQ